MIMLQMARMRNKGISSQRRSKDAFLHVSVRAQDASRLHMVLDKETPGVGFCRGVRDELLPIQHHQVELGTNAGQV